MKKYITKSISLLKNLPQQKNGAERCKGLILQKKWPIMKSKATKQLLKNPKYLGHKYKIHTCVRVAEEVTKEKDIVT